MKLHRADVAWVALAAGVVPYEIATPRAALHKRKHLR
jgi:hypothetical protein